jgi:hypothetical protein
MSDSLVLTGVKDVRKHTGTEMLRRNPKGGGDTFQLKRWWVEGGVSTVYVDATVFDVTTGDGTVKLALETSMSTNVRIDHDGSFNFTFIGVNELSRAALYTDSFELIEHYVFPAISGGKVMTVTPAGGASRPSAGPPATTIGTVSVTGATSASDGATETYTVNVSGGTASGIGYSWAVSGDGVANGGTSGTTFDVDLSTGNATVTCSVTSSDAGVTNSPQTDNVTVTVS